MRVLDLFCGEGGAGAGYARAGWDVHGVDNVKARLDRYPFACAQADALDYLLSYGADYDLIHASPPCTGYTRGTVMIPDRLTRYERLIGVVREALLSVGRPFVIENVEDARPELRDPLTLCWTQFHEPGSVLDLDGTPLWMRRHRLFETSWQTQQPPTCRHPARGTVQCAGAYGGARRDKEEARTIRHGGYVPALSVMQNLLGTRWMSEKGCQLSVPPSYTTWLAVTFEHAEQVIGHG